MSRLDITWIQGRWRGSREQTLQWYLDIIEAEVSPGTIVVLPELCHTPYFPIEESPEAFDMALTKDHPVLRDVAALAGERESVIVFPFFEKRHTGIYHNTVAIFDTDGRVAGIYRKSHIPDDPGFYEKYYFHPGDTGMRPIRTRLGTLGVLICWDQWFPEAARLMALAGADVLIYPTAIGWDENEPTALYANQLTSWQRAMQGHAVCNAIFTMAVNRVGDEGHLRFWGSSFMADPSGQIFVQSDATSEALFRATIDTEQMEAQRRMWPFFRDRRIDMYEGLLKRWID